MKVEPEDVILSNAGASISHDGPGVLVVTIEGDAGQSVTIEVPANTTVIWYPPAGWRAATFRAHGHAEELRDVEQVAIPWRERLRSVGSSPWSRLCIAASIASAASSAVTVMQS